MSILDRSALEESPLADLHAIASELSIDGYRRLRKADLIKAILTRQGNDEGPSDEQRSEEQPSEDQPSDVQPADEQPTDEQPTDEPAPEPDAEEPEAMADAVVDALRAHDEGRPTRRRRGRRGGRTRSGGGEDGEQTEEERRAEETAGDESNANERRRGEGDEVVHGVVELLSNGSGFMRVNPPEPSDDDVYISAAQVKRCDLVSGDRISGPRRAPRRSERFASLIRVDTINDRPASEVADSARFDDLPAGFPSQRFRLNSEDPTIKAIEWLTPFGHGSRVVIAGRAQSGKTEALRRLADALKTHEELTLLVGLIGVRPEEAAEWGDPAAVAALGASADAQGQALERVIDQGRRLTARGSHAVVLVDTLDGVPPHAAQKALAAARSIKDGGSLTVIATAAAPLGGETTVVALDAGLARTGRFPALDLAESWTMRPELLVGEAGAEAIARARSEAIDQ